MVITAITTAVSLAAVFFIILYFFSIRKISKLAAALTETIKKLEESQIAIKEEKAVSEIKVRARTRELNELAESLENKVAERTQELQLKLSELERFQKLAIGRELKMIELKEELEKLKNAKKKDDKK